MPKWSFKFQDYTPKLIFTSVPPLTRPIHLDRHSTSFVSLQPQKLVLAQPSLTWSFREILLAFQINEKEFYSIVDSWYVFLPKYSAIGQFYVKNEFEYWYWMVKGLETADSALQILTCTSVRSLQISSLQIQSIWGHLFAYNCGALFEEGSLSAKKSIEYVIKTIASYQYKIVKKFALPFWLNVWSLLLSQFYQLSRHPVGMAKEAWQLLSMHLFWKDFLIF